jgi:hypothetical protein
MDFDYYDKKYYRELRCKTDDELKEIETFQSSNWGSSRGSLCQSALIILNVIDKIRKERAND